MSNAWLAQSVERWTFNSMVKGSSPLSGVFYDVGAKNFEKNVIFNLNFKKILKSLEIVLNIEMILKKIKSLKNYENLESLEILV